MSRITVVAAITFVLTVQTACAIYRDCKFPVKFNLEAIKSHWSFSDISKEVRSFQECAEFCFRYPMCRSASLRLARAALICHVSYLGVYNCGAAPTFPIESSDILQLSPALVTCLSCPLERESEVSFKVPPKSHDTITPSLDNVVVVWNKFIQRQVGLAKLQPPESARFYAVVHTSIHRAFMAAYNQQKSGCSLDIVIAAAAHSALVSLLGSAREEADRLLKETYETSGCPEDEINQNYHSAYEMAKDVMSERARDGSFCYLDYKIQWDKQDGWRPPSPLRRNPILPCWGNVSLFELGGNADRFVPAGPPIGRTAKYRQDWKEIFSLGAKHSQTRLPEQTEAAILWDPPTFLGQFNSIVADVLKLNVEATDLRSYAKVFWLTNVALANTAIAIWRTKYIYHNWRPDTAFHTGHPEIPDLPTDVGWEPLLETPVFPDYPSGHSGMGAAVTTVLQAFFSDSQVFSVTNGQITHQFRSLEAAALENAYSRIYGGVHWRYSCDGAIAMGKQIAKAVLIRNAPEVDLADSKFLSREVTKTDEIRMKEY